MKTIKIALFYLPFLLIVSCGEHASTNPLSRSTVADTGFTGIKQYTQQGIERVVKETEFKNGVRNGFSKTFYASGKVRQIYQYKNDLREGIAEWYYDGGPVFRSTPFVRDTVHGIEVQHFRNGRAKAKMGFEKGLRTFFFEEYTRDGKLYNAYPDVVVKTRNNYNANGTYNISVELSDVSAKADYFRGDFSKGVYDPDAVEPIKTVNGVGNLTLKKSSEQTKPYVEILASILTGYGNRYLLVKRIDLPYNDLD